jgi:1-acyl-sn-glycerol-3-phosphate acyltransferase
MVTHGKGACHWKPGPAIRLFAGFLRILYVRDVAGEQNNSYGGEHTLKISALHAIDVLYSRIFHDLKVIRPSRLPAKGPAILVCNHISSLDPVLIQSVCRRRIRWMMAKEYFDLKPLQWFFKTVGVILVERSGRDLAATRTAMRALEEGYVLGIFAEGGIATTREMGPFHDGIGLLALRTGAPVFPAYLDGTQRGREMVEAMVRPCKARIAFGSSLDFGRNGMTRQRVQAATREIEAAVHKLRNEVYRASYGHPN